MTALSSKLRETVLDGTLGRKLILAFVGLAVVTGLVGAVGIYGVTSVSAASDQIADDGVSRVDGAMMLKLQDQTERAILFQYVEGEREDREAFDKAANKFDSVYESRLASRDDLSEAEASLLADIESSHQAALESAQAAMDAKDRGDTEAMRAHIAEYEDRRSELRSQLNDLEGLAKDRLGSEVSGVEDTQRTATALIAVLTLGALGGALVLGRRVGRSIGTEVERVRDVADRIAAGSVEVDFDAADRDDELRELGESFEAMTAYLGTVSDQARALADQRFDAAVLDEDVPGELGETMSTMVSDIETAQREAREARERVEGLNDSLEATAAEYRKTMDRAAEGDLSQRIDATSVRSSIAHCSLSVIPDGHGPRTS